MTLDHLDIELLLQMTLDHLDVELLIEVRFTAVTYNTHFQNFLVSISLILNDAEPS